MPMFYSDFQSKNYRNAAKILLISHDKMQEKDI